MKIGNSFPYLIGITIQVICVIWILSFYFELWGMFGIIVYGLLFSSISIVYFGLVYSLNPIKKLFVIAISIIGFVMLNILFILITDVLVLLT